MKQELHFAHGNGFPSLSYRKLLNELGREFQISCIDMIGHNPAYPITENWEHLVTEIITSIQTQCQQPVIGVGHSLGGVLTLIASIQQPTLFKAVILLDSPLIGRVKSRLVQLAKNIGFIDKITPAQRTKLRRESWPDKLTTMEYLRSKKLFKNFDQDCLEDYIDFGLRTVEDGYSLRFKRELEYQIYRTIPHKLPQYHKKLTIPAGLIYGQDSNVVSASDIRNMQKNYGMTVHMMQGGHMFPFEYPLECAQNIRQVLKQLL